MKILQITSGQFVNGALVHVNLLSRQLASRGHDVHVLCRPRSWIWRALSRTTIQRSKSNLHRIPPTELLRVARWVREEKFDVIHTHMSRAHFFGALLRRLTGVPCVATAHTTHFQIHWRMNDLVIANSDSTRDYQIRVNRVAPGKVVTIPCFVDLDRFAGTSRETRQHQRRRFGIHDDRPLIGMVGAVCHRKGQLQLVKALPALVREFPNLKVAFIGQFHRNDKATRLIRRELRRKELFRRVIWVGRRNNVHELIQALDVCVVPSLKEPLGLCAMEAMAAGVPVAAANVGGLKEIVRHEENGLLFNPLQPEEITCAVRRLLTDASMRDRLVGAARPWVLSEFNSETITTQIETALRSVTRGCDRRNRTAA